MFVCSEDNIDGEPHHFNDDCCIQLRDYRFDVVCVCVFLLSEGCPSHSALVLLDPQRLDANKPTVVDECAVKAHTAVRAMVSATCYFLGTVPSRWSNSLTSSMLSVLRIISIAFVPCGSTFFVLARGYRQMGGRL